MLQKAWREKTSIPILFSLMTHKDSNVIISSLVACEFVWPRFTLKTESARQPCTRLATVSLFLMFLVAWLLSLQNGGSQALGPLQPEILDQPSYPVFYIVR